MVLRTPRIMKTKSPILHYGIGLLWFALPVLIALDFRSVSIKVDVSLIVVAALLVTHGMVEEDQV